MKDLKLVPLFFLIFGIMARFLPHPANFAPITAIALFGARYLPKKFTFILPISIMLISDLFLGFYGSEMFFVYGSFILAGIIGLINQDKKALSFIPLASISSSVIFFLISNFGVWLTTTMYAKNLLGLQSCFIAAIPFFRSTLLSDLLYTTLFVGGYKLSLILGKKFLSRQQFALAF
jgi:hypothetical protein